jgi:hypothetical protein
MFWAVPGAFAAPPEFPLNPDICDNRNRKDSPSFICPNFIEVRLTPFLRPKAVPGMAIINSGCSQIPVGKGEQVTKFDLLSLSRKGWPASLRRKCDLLA